MSHSCPCLYPALCGLCQGVSCAQTNGCSELVHPHHLLVPFRGMKVLEYLPLAMGSGGVLVERFYSVE